MKRNFLIPALLLLVIFQFTGITKLYAQTAATHKTEQTAPASLNAFAGKYRGDNKMLFLQITIKDGHIVLKQSWDGEELTFNQTSPLDFYNEEHQFPLKFTKNNAGEVTQLLAFEHDTWVRVPDNYQPELQKIIKLTPAQLKALEGKFELKGGDGGQFLQITATNDHLILKQLWDQQEISFSPVSEVDFFNDAQTFPLKFTKGSDGLATAVLAFNKDEWTKVK
ncbi:MAG TPA: hypothetical protein VK668_14060 [Mucilaginibacter sp.]|nr:hypothetical protein [Mucilaginibacter sp.]